MDFNLTIWKNKLNENLAGWKVRFQRAGINTFYYGLAATSLLPVIQAYHSGEMIPALVALGGVSAGLGANLLANKIQSWKDKSEGEIAAELQTAPELKETIDDLLEKMETLSSAQSNLGSDAERRWFEELIRRELASAGSRITYQATLIGDGAIAQGNGAIALGKDAKYIVGSYTENKYASPDSKQIEADKNESARRLYLERMRKHCQSLPLAALGSEDGSGDEGITLDHVYIDLDTAIFIKKSDLEDLRAGKKVSLTESVIAKESPELMERMEEKKDVQSLPVWDAVRATPRVVLLGDPGAGKSTFARKMLGLQAAVMLKQCDPFPGFAEDLLPVLIVLRELTVNLDWQKLERLPAETQKKGLLDHIHQHLVKDLKRTSAEASTGLIQQALENGKVLLVLDGLDEVPQSLRKAVRQLVGALLSEYHIERLIITSRIRSYVGSAVFENIQTFTIRVFDEEKIRGFVKAWYNTQSLMGHVVEHDVPSRIQDLSTAAISDNLREISSNPMMLTSMAIIHQKEIGLPRERVRLYKLVVDVLLRRWQKYKLGEGQLAPSPDLSNFLMDDLRLLNAMERLAYEAHLAGKEKKEGVDLPRMRALEILEQKEYLNNIGLAEEFLDYVDQRTGLLKGNGGELEKPTSYGFPHRTFQEYLAGCYMVRDRNPSREYYQRAAEGDYWSLAALLGAEELYLNRRGKHTVLDLAYQLLPDGLTTEQDARASLWSAQVARIADVDEIKADMESPRGGEKYLASLPPRLLALFQSDLSPIERAEAGRVLAALGDPREEILQIEKMLFCRVPAGEFTMGENKEAHQVSLPEFYISRFPISNSQFDQFVKAEGYKQENYWKEAQQAGYWSDAGFKGRFDNEARNAPDDNGAPFNFSNHPVVGVSWYESLAFTRWLEEKIRTKEQFNVLDEKNPVRLKADFHICLPSESEWEKASRGTAGRKYPWDGEFNPNFANVSETGINTTSAMGCFPKGISPYGLLETSGNVWEWMRSEYEDSPYRADDGRENLSKKVQYRSLRGGSFGGGSDVARCAYRFGFDPDYWFRYYGFRVVVSPVLPS